MKMDSMAIAANTVDSNPGPRPPDQALSMTAAKNNEKTLGSMIGRRNTVIATAIATYPMAIPYREPNERSSPFTIRTELSNIETPESQERPALRDLPANKYIAACARTQWLCIELGYN